VWGIDTVVTALPRRYLNALWSTEMIYSQGGCRAGAERSSAVDEWEVRHLVRPS
jgi:hypothetical protein